jgi:hypothetical protein
VRLAEVCEGMVLGEDMRSRAGQLLVARGHADTPGLLVRMNNFAASVGVVEPIRVIVRGG